MQLIRQKCAASYARSWWQGMVGARGKCAAAIFWADFAKWSKGWRWNCQWVEGHSADRIVRYHLLVWERCRRSTSPGSFNHGTSTHGVSRCNVQFVSDNAHVLQSSQSELRRVRDVPVDQKGGCFVEAPGSSAVSCLDFRFLAFVRKADRHKPQWIQWAQEPEVQERSFKGRLHL